MRSRENIALTQPLKPDFFFALSELIQSKKLVAEPNLDKFVAV